MSKEVELNDGRYVNGVFQYSFLKTILETTENINLKENRIGLFSDFVLHQTWQIILWYFKDLKKEGLIRIDDLPKGLKTGADFFKFYGTLKIKKLSLFENGEREGEFITFDSLFFKDLSSKCGIIKDGKEIKPILKNHTIGDCGRYFIEPKLRKIKKFLDFGFFVSYICIVQSVQNKQKTRHYNGNQQTPKRFR